MILNIIATRVTAGAISLSNPSHLPANDGSCMRKPVIFPPGWGSPSTKPEASATFVNTIGLSASLAGAQRSQRLSDNYFRLKADQFFGYRSHPVNVTRGPTRVHSQVAALRPAQLGKSLSESGNIGSAFGITFTVAVTCLPRFSSRRQTIP
jgi:hypothetical protein